MKHITDVYIQVEKDYTLTVHFDYHKEYGDWETPPSETLDITKAELNGQDITSFYWDYLSDTMDLSILEYCRVQ